MKYEGKDWNQKMYLRFKLGVDIDARVWVDDLHPFWDCVSDLGEFTLVTNSFDFKELENGQENQWKSFKTEWLLLGCSLLKWMNMGNNFCRSEVGDETVDINRFAFYEGAHLGVESVKLLFGEVVAWSREAFLELFENVGDVRGGVLNWSNQHLLF